MRAIDLFCGAGGFSLGAKWAGIDVITAIDNSPQACLTHRLNLPGRVLCRDIRQVTGQELTNHFGNVDLIIGSPPCQGFSLMGKMDAADKRSSLIYEFARLVAEVNPDYFVMENVSGLAFGKFKRMLDELLDMFSAAGYLYSWRLINAADCGVPQYRKRLFIFGAKVGLTFPNMVVHPMTIPVVSISEALDDLPAPNNRDGRVKVENWTINGAANNTYHAGMREGFKGNILYNHRLPTESSPAVTARYSTIKPGQRDNASRSRRAKANLPAYCVLAGRQSNLHHTSDRRLTVRECARLQSFPDWFRFSETMEDGHLQTGNAVPPLMAKYVLERFCQVT